MVRTRQSASHYSQDAPFFMREKNINGELGKQEGRRGGIVLRAFLMVPPDFKWASALPANRLISGGRDGLRGIAAPFHPQARATFRRELNVALGPAIVGKARLV